MWKHLGRGPTGLRRSVHKFTLTNSSATAYLLNATVSRPTKPKVCMSGAMENINKYSIDRYLYRSAERQVNKYVSDFL